MHIYIYAYIYVNVYIYWWFDHSVLCRSFRSDHHERVLKKFSSPGYIAPMGFTGGFTVKFVYLSPPDSLR